MAQEYSRLMLVRADTLGKHPKAFQEYVERFFKKKVLCGTEYYYAFRFVCFSTERHGNKKGLAPSHRGDVNFFGEQLAQPYKGLYEWIDLKLRNGKQKDISEVSTSFDDGHGWGDD